MIGYDFCIRMLDMLVYDFYLLYNKGKLIGIGKGTVVNRNKKTNKNNEILYPEKRIGNIPGW